MMTPSSLAYRDVGVRLWPEVPLLGQGTPGLSIRARHDGRRIVTTWTVTERDRTQASAEIPIHPGHELVSLIEATESLYRYLQQAPLPIVDGH